jgi:hypothetical protein
MASGTYSFILQLTDKITAPAKKVQAAFQKSYTEVQKLNGAARKLPMTIADFKGELSILNQKRPFAQTREELTRINKLSGVMTREMRKLENYPPKTFLNRLREIPKAIMGISLKDIGMAYLARTMFRFVKESTKLYDVQMKAEAQLRASLESTGFTAGRTFEQLSKQAVALQGKTLFGDEQIAKAQSTLLTFKQIRSEVFDKSIPLVLDLATKMGGDLQGAVIRVGKSLNNPIMGMKLLQRNGMNFTDSQKKGIKELVEAGKLQEAQMIILSKLYEQYGGSAEAAAKVGLGPIQQLGLMWVGLRRRIGGVVLSIVNRLVPSIKSMMEWMEKNTATIKNVAKTIGILITGFVSYKLVVGLATLVTKGFLAGLTITRIGSIALQYGITGLTRAFVMLNAVTKANIIGAIASVAIMAVTAFVAFRKRTNETTEALKKAKEAGQEWYAQEKSWLDKHFEKLEKTNAKSKERIKLVNELLSHYPNLNKELATELKNTKDLAAAKGVLVANLQQEAISRGLNAVLNEKSGDFAKLELAAEQERLDNEALLNSYPGGRAQYEWDQQYTYDAQTGKRNVGMYDDVIGRYNRYFSQLKYDAQSKRDKEKAELDKLTQLVQSKLTEYFPTGNGLGDMMDLEGLSDVEKQLDTITGGGKKIKNIIINLDNLVGTNNNYFTKGDDPAYADNFMEKLTNALQLIVNDVNYAN